MSSRRTYFFVIAIVLCILTGPVNSKVFKVGAVFERISSETNEDLDDNGKALLTAIDHINYFKQPDGDDFDATIKYISPNDPYGAMRAGCELLEQGVVAVLGPRSEESSNIVQSICDTKEIPYIETRWNDHTIDGSTVNIYPDPDVLTKTYKDVLESRDWQKFVILYEDNTSLRKIVKFIDFLNMSHYKILLRQLDPDQNGLYRSTFKELRKAGETHFLIDCSIDILKEVLTQAQQVGLVTHQQSYFITNFDFHTLDLKPFQYAETNITGMRFIDSDSKFVNQVAASILSRNNETLQTDQLFFTYTAGWKLRLEPALIYDGVLLFSKIVGSMAPLIEPPRRMSCNDFTPGWGFGQTIVNFIKGNDNSKTSEESLDTPNLPELTGKIQFDVRGLRSTFALDIVELRMGGITKVGNWDTESEGDALEVISHGEAVSVLFNKTFIVYITLTEPYAMLKVSSDTLQGNDRFEGFGIDLIKDLSEMCGFNYTFIIRKDNQNGGFDNKTGIWTGMIGDVVYSRSEENVLAISDLTITAEREKAVDFTSPFMYLGIGILYQKPQKAPPGFFTFADPFAFEVWRLLCAAYFGVSIALFVLARICPAEWTNPFPCIDEPEYLINTLSLRNCFWFNIGSLMQQGSEIAPVAVPTRMVGGMWWFFTLIMVSSYTANLAAFLTTENPDPHFSDVHELLQVADEMDIKYGAKANGATANFFRDSKNNHEYQEIWEYMSKHGPEVMVQENRDGVIKAEKERYAFFMESTSIEYETERRCNLVKVGNQIAEKGYGIAMKKNSTYRNELSKGILKLQESGRLNELKKKWWQERRGGGQCEGIDKDANATPLDLKNVGGVFWVTIIGSLLALCLVFIEFIFYVAKESVMTKTPFKKALTEELKFYFRSTSMIKPVVYNNRDDSCSAKTKSEERGLEKQESYESSGRSRSDPRSSKPRRDNVLRPVPDIGFI